MTQIWKVTVTIAVFLICKRVYKQTDTWSYPQKQKLVCLVVVFGVKSKRDDFDYEFEATILRCKTQTKCGLQCIKNQEHKNKMAKSATYLYEYKEHGRVTSIPSNH